MVGHISSEEHREGEHSRFGTRRIGIRWCVVLSMFKWSMKALLWFREGASSWEVGIKMSPSKMSTRHHVQFTKAIAAMVYPMTQFLYQVLMGTNPSEFIGPQHPVEHVSWFDAVHCANALSRLCGYPSAYQIDGDAVHWDRDSVGWRLPTEAEWEYCAQGAAKVCFQGEMMQILVAWYRANSQKTTRPVCRISQCVRPL